MWDRWPVQRIGARAYMRSTYDRRGGNETADASHFLYQEAEDFNVTLDVEGPGILYFVRTNHWHGSPWHYEVDGVDHIVQETTTADPTKKLEHSVFIPEDIFPNPLTWTYSITKGADLMWVPIPFERSFRLAYSRTFYGTGYYIYHHYVPGALLSQPIVAFDFKTPPDPAVLDLLNRAGTDIAPKCAYGDSGDLDLKNVPRGTDGSVPIAMLSGKGACVIRALKFSVPREQAVEFGRVRLRIIWDGRSTPSVDAPICLFFGAGTLYNRDDREYLVKALPVNVRYAGDRVHLACYFPMPFFASARIELADVKRDWDLKLSYECRYDRLEAPANHVGYLHATYRDHPDPALGKDLVLLDTNAVEGGGDWSGSFVGTSFIFSHRAYLRTLEGDPRFFFDDSRTPQCYGTGTEEWGGGGDYWGGRNMTLPLAGHPCGARNAKQARNEEDMIESAYRFLLADLMPFGKRAVIRLEHGGENNTKEHYETVAFWYGLNAPSLVKTDELDVGDTASERAHDYVSPEASEPVSITSRYEWGVDHISVPAAKKPKAQPADHTTRPASAKAGSTGQAQETAADNGSVEVYPAHTEVGRHTKGTSEFTVKLLPENLGVLLRRTLDYAFPNQRAEVYVADIRRGRSVGEFRWEAAGTWYLAGSNTCYHSYPRKAGELGKSDPVVQTSNRRFRDDEFLLPRRLTEGRSAIRVRVRFTPVNRPLLPGRSVPELAWSEIRYTTYCFMMPKLQGTR